MMSGCVDTVGFLVDSLLRQSFQDWELLLVAQGNDFGLLSAVTGQREKDARIQVVQTEHFGRSRALNLAAMQARGEILAFTDDDCEAQEDWLRVIWDHFSRLPDVGIVAGDLRPNDRRRLLSVCPATWTTPLVYRPSEHNYSGLPGYYWGGANFAVRREVFDRVGGFDPYFGPGTAYQAAEDTDFGLRSELLDVVVATTPEAVIYHTYGRRTGIRQCLKHLRAYASGQGALGGKLELMRHPWASKGKQKFPFATGLRRRPLKRVLMDFYQDPIRAEAKQKYLRNFRIGPNNVTEPVP